jgi:GDPmannose 4,6-dehydratase
MRILPLEARFYQASSSEMYGRVKTLPVNEETALYPVSPYAISKATDHWLAIHYREAYGLFCSCGILFNHESVLRPRHFVTKKIIATAVRIQRGSRERLRLGNMEIKRDWGYAPEYVKAMWLMLQQERPDDYVIATNEAHSLREFTEHVFTCLGLHWEEHVIIDKDLMRPSDIDIIYGSSEKAEEKLGWEYHISFEELVELLVREELECGAAGGST